MSRSEQREICHLVYRIRGRDDIVHRFSPEGYEMLSGEFLDYPEQMRSSMKDHRPVLMEITGAELSPEDREAAERALRTHYRLRLVNRRKALKRNRLRCLWFLLSFVLSAVLLFAVKNEKQDLVVQFAYLPFWFFGYRLLTYPLLEYLPGLREARWLDSLASMKLVFTETPLTEISEELRQETLREVRENTLNTLKETRGDETVRRFLLEGDTVCLETAVGEPEALLDPHSVPGRERISGEFFGWLEEAVPFITPDRTVQLTIHNSSGDPEDRKAVTAGLEHYFAMSLADAQKLCRENNRRIIGFAVGLALASIVLFVWGARVNVAWHEMMLITLWFFGDYLVEYVLLTDRELREDRARREKMKDTKILFD